jgi:hypothetical protein
LIEEVLASAEARRLAQIESDESSRRHLAFRRA